MTWEDENRGVTVTTDGEGDPETFEVAEGLE